MLLTLKPGTVYPLSELWPGSRERVKISAAMGMN